MFPLGSPSHLYADDVHAVSLPVIIGSTICKGVEYTPLFLSLREEVCALTSGYSICPVCICIEYICVWLYLTRVSGEIQSGEEFSSHRLESKSRHISDVNLKMKDIFHAFYSPLLAHSSDIERAFHISEERCGWIYLSVPSRLPYLTSVPILALLIHYHKYPFHFQGRQLLNMWPCLHNGRLSSETKKETQNHIGGFPLSRF